MCIEAAFHFNKRTQFLSESFRVLKPGGKIVMADILFKSNWFLDKKLFPKENNLKCLKDYKRLLERQGFTSIQIHDVTDLTFKSFRNYMLAVMLKRYPIEAFSFIFSRSINISKYVFISAEKPLV